MEKRKLRVILSGGGTGGHIYPAVATAEALKRREEVDIEILFVGADGKMEMEKIPALGYEIMGLPVTGLYRKLDMRNLLLPIKVLKSLSKAKAIIKKFNPDIVAGFGGYASAPILWAAQRLGIPTLIQEQNSYAGMTNKILSKRAKRICVSYDAMDRFFEKDKIVLTGNPLRGKFGSDISHCDALAYFGLQSSLPTVLIVGGSLGTRTLNNMMKEWVDRISESGKMQVIWQNGKFYDAEMSEFMSHRSGKNIWRGAFIDRMDYAYEAADIVVSRSGACSVSELCLVGKPTIFVPSPNVAEDHQTKNAKALADKNAALMIPDSEAIKEVFPIVERLLEERKKLEELSKNIRKLAIEDSADRVANQIIALIKKN